MTATPQSYANHRRVFPLYHLFALPVLIAHVAVTLVGALREPRLWTFWMVVVAVGLVAAVVANRASTLIVQNRVIGLEMRLRLATVLPVELCQRIVADLRRDVMAVYDDTASIGKLYRRQDEIGTPWCVTVDVESLEDGAVTVRDRDSMTQERVPLEGVKQLILDRLAASRGS